MASRDLSRGTAPGAARCGGRQGEKGGRMNGNTQTAPASLKLGVIGNCAYSALIDERGRIVWCCLPRFDGDPVFNALLDGSEAGSVWAFEIENFQRSEQDYRTNTAILRTRLYDQEGQG